MKGTYRQKDPPERGGGQRNGPAPDGKYLYAEVNSPPMSSFISRAATAC